MQPLLRNQLQQAILLKRLCVFGLFMLITVQPNTAQVSTKESAQEIALSQVIEREIAGKQAHTYQIALTAGQYLHLAVEQRGVDIVILIFDPQGNKLVTLNTPNGRYGTEPIHLVAQSMGTYKFEVTPLYDYAAQGSYRFQFLEIRPATSQDQVRIEAQTAYAEAEEQRRLPEGAMRLKAIENYERALSRYREVGDREREIDTLEYLGHVHNLLGHDKEWRTYSWQSYALAREIGNPYHLAVTTDTLAGIALNDGDFQQSLHYQERSSFYYHQIGDRINEATALISTGVTNVRLGNLQKAIDLYYQALAIDRAENYPQGQGHALHNLGSNYRRLGDFQRALDVLNEALQIQSKVNDWYLKTVTLNNLGLTYYNVGNYEKAVDTLQQSLQLARTHSTPAAEGIALHSLGIIYLHLGQRAQARESFEQSLSVRRKLNDRYGEATTLNKLGETFFHLGDSPRGMDFFKQALEIRIKIADRVGMAESRYWVARAALNLSEYEKAHNEIETALKLLEEIRANLSSQDLRISFLATFQQYYELYIEISMRSHRDNVLSNAAAKALEVSERSRARSLIEILTEAQAEITGDVNNTLLEKKRSLQQQINAKEQARTRLLAGKYTEEKKAAFDKEISQLLSEYQLLNAQIRASNPKYASLTQPHPLSLKEIQQQVLDQDTLLLEYALGEERSYLWLVSQDSIKSYSLPKRAEVETIAKKVYDALTERNKIRQGETPGQRAIRLQMADTNYAKGAVDLSQVVLGPIAKELGKKRLLVVADGALQYIPFAALPDPVSKGVPLLVAHEVVNAPSASTIAILRRETAGRKSAPKAIAVLADPVFDKEDGRVKKALAATQSNTPPLAVSSSAGEATRDVRGIESIERDLLVRSAGEIGLSGSEGKWPPLPATGLEADSAAATVPKEQALKAIGFRANKTTATDASLSEYRVIHFATHGLLNSEHPELSGLVLSLVNEQGQDQDGFLRLHEVYNLKLNADLVVLSACQTGLGKSVKGEGLVGLTRGFMYAGAPRIVASLWSVRDFATAELMKRFYREMFGANKLPPAEALRQAQLSMLRQAHWSAPYFWAAFTLQGEWR